ncbi:MAG: nicotinamide-nucleotide adenylyltransferase [Thermoplasmata archaeon]
MRGLIVGRFQPFHAGHLATVRRIRAKAPEADLVLAIGSAEESYTWENPFTASERFEMVVRALAEARLDRVITVPVPDIHRHSQWVRYLEGLLPSFDRVYTHNPLTRLLFEKAGYPVESPPLVDRGRLEGRKIRELLAGGRPLGRRVPPAVGEYLASLDAVDRLRLLRDDRGRRGVRRP